MALLSLGLLSNCGEAVYDEIELVSAPALYRTAEVDPFAGLRDADIETQTRLLYVTTRRPAEEGDAQAHYLNARDAVLRAGSVEVVVDPPFESWDDVRTFTAGANRETPRRIGIAGVEEFGVLPVGDWDLLPVRPSLDRARETGRRFAEAVDEKLAGSSGKDAIIYVHGYNVDFGYSTLTSRELQHNLGYRGVFIAFSWPATPNRFAYFKDLETAGTARKNLRDLLVFLSEETEVERIHLLGYSAGSRLAFETVYDIALKYEGSGDRAPRIGHLILVGSDLDRTYFGQAVGDGLLEAADDVTVYMSGSDGALGLSSLILGRERLGQIWEETELTLGFEARLRRLDNLHLIDVTDAEGAATGNGHWYFRSSPWASSDILISLLHDLPPGERGLVRAPDRAIWQFPENYPERLEAIRSEAEN